MAFSTEELLSIYQKFDAYLHLSNAGSDILRTILFGPLKLLAGLVNSLGQLMYEATALLGFWSTAPIGGTTTVANGILNNAPKGAILELLRPFQSFGVAASILILGATYLLGKSEENKEVVKNMFFIIVIVGLLPSIMVNGVKVVKGTTTTFELDQGNLGVTAIKSNTADLYTFIDDGWQSADLKEKNHLEDLIGLDINEIIDEPEQVDKNEVLANKIVAGKKDSSKEVEALPEKSGAWIVGNLINMLIPRYYRWSINWLPAYVTVIALLLSIVISLARIGRLGMESAVNYIWANIIAFFSFRDITRLKTTVMQILIGFITIISIFVLFFVFIYYMTFVSTVTDNVWLSLFGIIGGCILLYDGPAIVQQLFGVDAGLGSAGAAVIGAGTGLLVRSTTRSARGVALAGAGAGGFLSGFLSKDTSNEATETDDKAGQRERGEKNEHSNVKKDESDESVEQNETQQKSEQEQAPKNQSIDEQMNQDGDEETNEGSEKNSESPMTGMLSEEEADDVPADSNNEPKNSSPLSPVPELEGDEMANDPADKAISPVNELETRGNSETEVTPAKEKSQSTVYPEKVAEHPSDQSASEVIDNQTNQRKKSEPPEKPTNPIWGKVDKALSTPTPQKRKNVYTRAKGSHQLGKDYRDYRNDKKQYKKTVKDQPLETDRNEDES